jgi:hypothetical protein
MAIYWSQALLAHRLLLTIKIQSKILQDYYIQGRTLPLLSYKNGHLLGQRTGPFKLSRALEKSSEFYKVLDVLCQRPCGSPIFLKPLILPIPVSLWGCGLLEY